MSAAYAGLCTRLSTNVSRETTRTGRVPFYCPSHVTRRLLRGTPLPDSNATMTGSEWTLVKTQAPYSAKHNTHCSGFKVGSPIERGVHSGQPGPLTKLHCTLPLSSYCRLAEKSPPAVSSRVTPQPRSPWNVQVRPGVAHSLALKITGTQLGLHID